MNKFFSSIGKGRGIMGIVIALFLLVSILSFTSIKQLHGNARVVNYVGIVRGATQKLVKGELQGKPDEELLLSLDAIVLELTTGEGKNGLSRLPDPVYLAYMEEVSQQWEEIKQEIYLVRSGQDGERLFDMSEAYFILADTAVHTAEEYSERRVKQTTNVLLGLNILFVVLLAVSMAYYMRMRALRKKADELGKMAYVDQLLQLPNRASCEREVARRTHTPPQGDTAVLMFDMNNLKEVNDRLGHQQGDKILVEFSAIIGKAAVPYGFVGRYGGDEFLGIFDGAGEAEVREYLAEVEREIERYNRQVPEEMERLSYAVGYVVGTVKNHPILEMINEADRNMYRNKRRMKAKG